jgi:hypothetical protein
MIRYGALLSAALFIALAFMAKTGGTLAVVLLMVVVSGTVAVFGFAAARIDQSSKHHVYVPTPEEAELLRRRAQRQREDFERSKGAGKASTQAAAQSDSNDPLAS